MQGVDGALQSWQGSWFACSCIQHGNTSWGFDAVNARKVAAYYEPAKGVVATVSAHGLDVAIGVQGLFGFGVLDGSKDAVGQSLVDGVCGIRGFILFGILEER